MRKHGRVDQNHKDVVAAFRALGAEVISLADLGGGVPDLLVGLDGASYLVEVKQPRGTLRPDQEAFMEIWPAPVSVVRDVDDVIAMVTRLRRGL